MKAKTKIQKKIIGLSKLLPKVTKEQKKYALKTMHNTFVALSYKYMHHCLECAHVWNQDVKETKKAKSCICPKCNQKLKVLEGYNNGYSQKGYFAIITTIKGMQVVRLFLSTKYYKKGRKFSYSLTEVMQHFINEDGNINTISKPTQSFSPYYDSWAYGDLEFRTKSNNDYHKSNLYIDKIHPKIKTIPIIKRNGFKNGCHGMLPHFLFKALIQDNRIETLFKLKQYGVMQGILYGALDADKYWHIIKIALRNDYRIKKIRDWKDYIDLLIFFNKDVRNAKYVCPENLAYEHNKYVNKKKTFQKKQKFNELKAKIKTANIIYKEQKEKFFGLVFKERNLTITPIISVKEFFNEGEDLGHCLFANEYYTKENSLIFSAKVKGDRVETIQISLKDFQIEQSRGLNNIETKYNARIKNLVNKNINLIKKIAYKTAS